MHAAPGEPAETSRHEAMLYSGDAEFVAEVVPFIRHGLRADEPVMVAVSAAKIGLIRGRLGADADRVEFHDMTELGRNPARIIPAWQRFLDTSAEGERRARGVGEPVWAGRSPAELAECEIHEHLLNVVLEETFGFWLVCPYDVAALGWDCAEDALRTHPTVCDHGQRRTSAAYRGLDDHPGDPLEPPAEESLTRTFDRRDLHQVRETVWAAARRADLGERAAADLVLAVSEIAANSIRHGGGGGTLRVWEDRSMVYCEVVDAGRIADPLAGRRRPNGHQLGGRGLWLVNQVCDLVQIRSDAGGTTVRVHKQHTA